ncbi:MAG: hypothetical protein VB858_20305 [Planctomycetaceae bacterium]|jgi:hypothetical protein
MKITGSLIFILGVMIGITAAAKLSPAKTAKLSPDTHEADQGATDELARWPDTVPTFWLGVTTSVVGLGLWWSSVLGERSRARAAGEGTGEGSVPGPAQLVAQIQQPLKDLGTDIERLDGPELCQRVEALNDGFVTPLADARQRFVDRFGLAGGSEALNETAFGERMLNRVWSAAADGHLEEARSSFEEAIAAFAQAEETVTRLTDA